MAEAFITKGQHNPARLKDRSLSAGGWEERDKKIRD